MPLEEGKIYDGVVTSIAPFGIFVQLPEGKSGLVHISEIADSYVKDIKEHIAEKQNVRVKVLNIGADGKINLSIRQAKDPKAVPKPAEVNWNTDRKQTIGSFEDKLSKFLKDSEENILTMKKQEGNRRGNSHRKK